jgi:hypothetical protein
MPPPRQRHKRPLCLILFQGHFPTFEHLVIPSNYSVSLRAAALELWRRSNLSFVEKRLLRAPYYFAQGYNHSTPSELFLRNINYKIKQ